MRQNVSLVEHTQRPDSGKATSLQLAKRFGQNVLGMEAHLGGGRERDKSRFWEYHLTYDGERFRALP